MEELYEIKLPVFEGPLDLLLHLIREAKIDIYDIPISFITHRYLEYIEMMKELNLDIAGEFLVMAATLIQIKSRMLLPPDEVEEAEQAEDPRLELVQRLLEYQTYKDAAFILKEKEEDALLVFGRAAESVEGEEAGNAELCLFDVNIFDLLGAFKKMLDSAPPEVRTITREVLTVKDRMVFIMDVLDKAEATRFEELFEGEMTRSRLIVSFLALLELIRLGLARVYQEREFGNIWIIKRFANEVEAGPGSKTSVSAA
jgi:segregation and condensation protein A